MEPNRKNTDCYFFYYATCLRGNNCTFRHEPSALGCEITCSYWQQGNCLNEHCNFRHMKLKENSTSIPCYWEMQAGGCRMQHCSYMHMKARNITSDPINSVKTTDLTLKPINQELSNCQDEGKYGILDQTKLVKATKYSILLVVLLLFPILSTSKKTNTSSRKRVLVELPLDLVSVKTNHSPRRSWISLPRPNRTGPTCIFKVMSYNILCDKYATRQKYRFCPSWALDWEYRKKIIMDEVRHYAADIISLQEVETNQFYHFFLPELKRDGYDGIFSPKSRAKTMTENDRKFVDGCAIFFKTAKFTLIKEHLMEFSQLAIANAEGSDVMLNRVMPKDNIGLAALLKTKEAAWDNGLPSDPAQVQQPILVCTTHIHWNPEYCDVKLIQTMMLTNELRSILDQASQSLRPGHKTDASNIQLLLCGDFNSLPDSGVIEFLKSGRVAADHPDFKKLAYKSCLQKISVCDKPNEFKHSFKLASACGEDIMPYTIYTFHLKRMIDYIFYSEQSMVPLGLLGPLSADWIKEHGEVCCPNQHVPSDHFPLVVELEMTPTVGKGNDLISRT